MTLRDAILRGAQGATQTLQAFRQRDVTNAGSRAVDVFGLIDELDIPLYFERLENLLGACIRASSSEVGILITTQRDLHMQRFTAAHELGHFVLEHEGSLDREIRFPGQTHNRDLLEVEADTFAAELLMPKWLIRDIAKRKNWWDSDSLRSAGAIYQLGLRMSVSYQATCWTLAAQRLIDLSSAQSLAEVPPKKSKKELLQELPLEDPWADVWALSEADDGCRLEAGPTDLLVVDLTEKAGAGYVWEIDDAVRAGFSIKSDSCDVDEDRVGAPVKRRLVMSLPNEPGTHTLSLEHRRPFARSGGHLQQLDIEVSNHGAHKAGGFEADRSWGVPA